MTGDAVSAHDAAAELRRRVRGLGVKKLHKLLYYAQGWHLAWTGRPLFEESLEAWDRGPVVADLWRDEKHDRERPEPRALPASALEALSFTLEKYGRLTGLQLENQTHREAPWLRAREAAAAPWSLGDQTIPQDFVTAWFRDQPEYVAHTQDVAELRSIARFDLFELRTEDGALDAYLAARVDC